MKKDCLSRRTFLQLTAVSLGAFEKGLAAQSPAGQRASISLVADPADAVVSAPSVAWALQELISATSQNRVTVRRFASIEQAPRSDFCIVIAGANAPLAAGTLKRSNVVLARAAESLALVPSSENGRHILLACGNDRRGLMYAVLKLADRVSHADDPLAALSLQKPVAEQPFNEVRSIGRLFVSDVEDKPWFNDREMWPAYFLMLATQRFNRFSLNFGIGFDSLRYVTDSYFLFAYPFLMAVPGHNVRAVNLPDAERDRNLETLQFISRQAVTHGIDFQLGLWTHGYEWMDTPHSNYTIAGLTPENHAAYCRDALTTLLKACPEISGVTLRTHAESGVHEGSYDFWQTVFDGFAKCGRKVEIDLHTKGLDQKLLDLALATGMPVKLSPKYWAEHMGLPYHQTAIRELERLPPNTDPRSFSALSTGSRIFTRYGYADFLREDRPYTVMYRIWPGTHRVLAWGDPVSTAAHSRAFRFCGSNGAELYEPLSFKGRRGSGLPGGRCAYADPSLTPGRDWEKYLYTYRVWGRLLYNPDADADVWHRPLRKQLGPSAAAIEASLGSATRILPLVVTAHLPSAANDTYGPEFYTNQSIPDPSKSAPYGDTPAPKIFGNVSPLDPQLFLRINDFAEQLLKGERSAKYTPVEVAQWLEDLAATAITQLSEAEKQAETRNADLRRIAADVKIQAGLGRFFAAKFRAAALYAIHEQSGDRVALEESLRAYRGAREIWSQLAAYAGRIYVADITYGPRPYQRGHWLDRLPAIDADIATMANRLGSPQGSSSQTGTDPSPEVRSAIQEILGRPKRWSIGCRHTSHSRFVPNRDFEIVLSLEPNAGEVAQRVSARLYYRHVNQAENYQSLELQRESKQYREAIPASYMTPTYSLQYYFELMQPPNKACLYPGFAPDLDNQPYFVVRPTSGDKS
jgi:hypothetical protein